MHKGDGQQKKRLDGAGAESKAGGEAFYIPYMSGVEEGGEVKEEYSDKFCGDEDDDGDDEQDGKK